MKTNFFPIKRTLPTRRILVLTQQEAAVIQREEELWKAVNITYDVVIPQRVEKNDHRNP